MFSPGINLMTRVSKTTGLKKKKTYRLPQNKIFKFILFKVFFSSVLYKKC